MRLALLAVLLAASNAPAFWGWHPPYHHVYYAPPVYHVPHYYYPVYSYSLWCECPPAMATQPMPPHRVPATPPARMPEKAPAKAAAPETVPYAPIAPAAATSEEKIPKIDVPTSPKPAAPAKKDDFVPGAPPKVELAPAAPAKIELPPATPAAPKIELPPLPTPSTSRYRPLSVTTTPLEGDAKDGKFAIVFLNHSERDVELMVDGAKLTLPPKHTTTATVGRNYRMSIDGGDVEFKAVAAKDRGAEIVLK